MPEMSIDQAIHDLSNRLPEFLRPTDLVNFGLFKSRSDLCVAMKRGSAPPSIKLSSHKVVFPRGALCKWLLEKAEISGGSNDASEAS